MRLWLSTEYIPSVAVLILKKTPINPQQVGFHLSILTGFVDSAPYFCMATEMVECLAKEAITQRDDTGKNHLETEADARAADDTGALEAQSDAIWQQLPAEQHSSSVANVYIYLDAFMYVVQKGPKGRCQLQIDKVFCPNG